MNLIFNAGDNDLGYPIILRKELGYVEEKRIRQTLWMCPVYKQWSGMLERCYSKRFKENNRTYIDCACTEEWLKASVFKTWMLKQNWENKSLDKDIIVFGNKLYSPDTCAFVNRLTNNFVLDSKNSRGVYPIGVNLHKITGKFVAQCRNPFANKQEHLGLHTTPEEAHKAWRKHKHELAQLVAETETDPRVVAALQKRYSYDEWYKHNPICS